MCSTPPAGVFLPADETATGDICQRRRLAVAESNVQMLSPAGLLARKQGGHDTIASVQSSREIRHRNAYFYWGPVSRAGNVHQAEFGFNHNVISSPLRVRTRLAIASDGCINQRRVDLVYRVEIQIVLFQRSWYVVLDKDVTLCSELVEYIYASWILKGESQGLFVAVDLLLLIFSHCRRAGCCQCSHLRNMLLHRVHCVQSLACILHMADPMLSCRRHELDALS